MQRAVAAHGRGDLQLAENSYRELAERHPDFSDAWHYLGLVIHQRGGGDAALEPLQRAHALDPDNFIFLLNFGRILREQGDLNRALECFDQAHQLQPDAAPGLVGLAETMIALQRGDELIPELRARLEQAGRSWHLWSLLGQCLDQSGDRPGALQAFAEAASLAPADEVTPHLQRAECARKDMRYDIARREMEHTLRIAPNSAGAHYGLANLAALEGNFEECARLARRTLELDPRHYPAWGMITSTRERNMSRDYAKELERAAREAGDDVQAWPLHLARGKAWERLQEYDRAFEAYATANGNLSRMRPYMAEMHIEYARNMFGSMNADFLARHRAVSERDRGSAPRPIFVCGMPRSGTTLTETILASHPQVNPGGEMRYVHDLFKRTLGNLGLINTGKWLGDIDTDTLMELATGWDRVLTRAADGRPYITDKMPSNYMHMVLLHLCFPDSPIFYMKRDARDNCFSCFTTSFAEGHHFSYAQESLAHFYLLHQASVAQWNRVLGEIGENSITEISYEELASDPETQVPQLVAAAGLPWDPRCLEFHKTKRTVMTASVYQVRQPMYNTSIGRWHHFERHLGPLVEALKAKPAI